MARRAILTISFSLLLFVCPMMFGQATGSFSGTISDKTGSVISGASVKVTSQSTGAVREAKTDDSGHYLITLLPVSIYTIKVESQGFQTTEQKDVKLQTDEHPEVNFTLAPGNVTENIEVTAGEVAVETTNPSLGQVITSQQVAELPLNGRDFVQLATLTPGTTQETNPGSFFNGGPSSEVSARGSFSLSVGGSRASSTDWLLDGNDNNELTAGGIAILPSIDAIQEFKVLTYNYSAQYGTRAGPTVLVTTKSGSNQIHGSLFEFFRNTDLDAKSYFASSREQFNLNQFGGAVGGAIKKDKTFFFLDYQAKMQRHGTPFVGLVPTGAMRGGDYTLDPYGVDARGPGNPNGFGNIVNPYTGSQFQCDGAGAPIPAGPTGVQTSGTPCNKIPTNLFDPIGMQMINLFPLPNASNPGAGFNYADVPVRKLNEGEWDTRIDHNFSSKDSLFARFSYDQATSFVPGGAPGFAEQNAFASSQNIDNHGRNATISETHVFSDRTINQFQVGFNRIFNSILSFGDRSCESARLGIQGANLSGACDSFTGLPGGLTQSTTDCVSCGLSSTQLAGGYYSLGDRGFAPFQGGTNVFSASDSWNTTRGNHSISIGGAIRANQMNVLTNGFQDGYFLFFGGSGFNTYTLDSSSDLLLGQVSGAIHDQTFDGATTGRRWKMFRPYVEDNWRITKDLTANIGLAWAIVTPITEAENRQANFDFVTGKFLIPGSTSDGRVGVQLDKTAFEPRIGLSWKPFGSETTAIRAGYAIFHDSSWNQGAQGLWQNPPFYAESDNFSGLCPVGNASSATPLNCGLARSFQPIFTAPPDPYQFQGTIQSQNTDFKQGRVQQFNLNIEHQLPGNLVVTAGYAGSRSSHILVDGVNLNVSSPTACGTVPGYTLGCGQPNIPWGPPTFPNGAPVIDNITDSGSARYDSLQFKAETKSAKHGLYALLSYTYARVLDSGFPDGVGTSTGATYWPLPGTQKADWALSQIDLKHNLSASVIYDLPFGKGKQFGNGWSGATNTILGNWEVDVIEKITSGFPIFVFDSSNNSGVQFNAGGNSFNRPDQVCDPKASDGTLQKFFNTQCFAPAAMGELGNASRTPVYGPDFVNTDFSAIKHFMLPYREGMQLDFRAEFFNIFNHAQFGSPTADIESPQFGEINTTVNNPRVMQFALKLTF
ncbi:MAG TPA: carboxypeptidase-like regulatory domain-containing protein [Terriglobales bacterium]|nr:carboxypeptidase-like regulatory domain-containing protein [Terriglobales bacterium]